MKNKTIIALTVILMVLAFVACCVTISVSADESAVRTNKQDALHEAAETLRAAGFSDDSDAIKALRAAWMREQEDLNIVAKVIQNEADPAWCEWEHSVAVGAVVMNRVSCPWFVGDTVKEIVCAPRQYNPEYTYDFSGVSRLAYLAAKDALDGNHNVPANAYWQDNKVQGCYIWKTFRVDTDWFHSTTYICCGIPGVD